MSIRPSIAERAYQLARSGDCATITDIKERLKREGYWDVMGHLQGGSITAPLRKLLAEARKAAANDDPAAESSATAP
jgi:hypothetical protein